MKNIIILLPYFKENNNKNNNNKENDIEYDERVYINIDDHKRVWLKDVNEEFIFIKDDIKYVFDDVSIYYYLKYKNINIDYIFGDDININEKIKDYDNIFLLYFDKLQAFHSLSKENYNKIEHIFGYKNMCPNNKLQNFVYYKNVYYDFLKENNIKVLPYLHILKTYNIAFIKSEIEKFIKKETSYFIKSKKLYIKPIFGQNSYDSITFTLNDFQSLIDYMEKYKNKYDSFIIQPFVHNFYYNYEYRNFFIENNHIYTIRSKLNTKNDKNETYIEEYIPYINCVHIVEFAKKVFNTLKNKKILNHNIILAIDICYDDNNELFVSEIEFSPYLFNYKNEVNHLYIDQKIGNSIINYMNNNINNINNNKSLKINKLIQINDKKEVYFIYFILIILIILLILYIYFILHKNYHLTS